MNDTALLSTQFVHNTDLQPPKEYLATVPRVQLVLRYPALIETFDRYDRVANYKQRLFRLTGMVSLLLGGVSLVGIATELFLAALTVQVPPLVTALLELSALGSLLFALGPWFAGTRTQWLAARFMTEQIRQWHFQMLLDGNLVSKAYAAPVEFQAERAKRWARFMAVAPNVEGAMNSFVDADSSDLYHPIEPCRDPAAAEELLRAYVDLRFNKQMAYFKFKREYFAMRDDVSEAFARWMIFSALLVTGGQLILAILRVTHDVDALHRASETMFSAAIVLVILSAIIRVYRSAIALSPQRERYDAKWVRLVALRSAYDAAPTVENKLCFMKDLEIVEGEELREFLRQMRRASYLL
jgi:hypothetical protein